LEPWFFWDEDPEESKPGRFGRFSRAAKAGQDSKPAKVAKERKAAKAAKDDKAAAKAHELLQAYAPVQADAPTLAIEPVLAGEPVRAGESVQAVPEASPDGGHRGSRARLVRRPIATTAVLAGLLAVVGGAVGLTRLTGRPADVPRPVAKSVPAPHGLFAAPPEPHSSKQVSRPVALIIPAIGVRTALETLGRTPQGTLQVPDSTTIAGWYTGSPRPGEIGSSIIAGHIDSTSGPGVFFRLRLLRRGELVYVRRADRALAVFRVTAEHMYRKNDFPTEQVYGPVPDAELHLITCGGTFDPVTGSYLGNVVVYATQIRVHPPRHHHHGGRHGHHPRARHS
jgi:sortase (surface protein transpeptidase)